MEVVVLMSGGMDSSLVAAMAADQGLKPLPLFIDYGQLAANREWKACRDISRHLGLPDPARVNASGYGQLIPSGLTSTAKAINEDAFLPGRNLLFVVIGAAYAFSRRAEAVAIGLLDERARIFPDQSRAFLSMAEELIAVSLGTRISVLAPLIDWPKAAVIRELNIRGVGNTYSCHAGRPDPCGRCISCLEIESAREATSGRR